MSTEIGKRIIDLSGVLDQFEAQEGEVQHIIGATGQGKTYEGTRRALNYLYSGYTVYTTWRLNLPAYYDEREHLWPILKGILFGRRRYFRFDLQKNWHHVDLKSFDDDKGIFNTDKFAEFLATRTDCIFMLDEGQDTFDSHSRAGKVARQSITRTRHMHKTLIIISQRAQAVDVNARANVTYFYRCEKKHFFFWTRFKVFRTTEIDESSCYPIWVRHDSTGRVVWKAPVWYSAWADKRIYDAYDSWYMRQSMIRSQDIKVDAFELSYSDRVRAFFKLWKKPRNKPIIEPEEISLKVDEHPIDSGEKVLNLMDGIHEERARAARSQQRAKKVHVSTVGLEVGSEKAKKPRPVVMMM